VHREQLPIMPLLACPLYGLQGTTADPGLVAHWTVPKKMGTLVSFDFSNDLRAIIERGPPDNFVGSFDRLFGDKIEATRKAAREARRLLGRPLEHPTGEERT